MLCDAVMTVSVSVRGPAPGPGVARYGQIQTRHTSSRAFSNSLVETSFQRPATYEHELKDLEAHNLTRHTSRIIMT
jgi:hypothetical protein